MKGRLFLSLVILALWTGGIVYRLAQLQIRDHEHYSQRAEGQHHRKVELLAPRGTIFDTRGRELAVSVEVDSVWVDPSRVEDTAAMASQLAAVLKVDRQALARSMDGAREFAWVARLLDPPQAAAVRDLRLPGVRYLKESKRYYPMRQVASQVVGFAGVDNRGLEGIEGAYNNLVAGKAARRGVLRDARRGTVLLPSLSFRDPQPGSDLYLTIDVWIQYLLEKELSAAVQRTGAKSGTALILDPNSGAILAMASVPTFDPNHFGEYGRDQWRNRAVTDSLEPGSTFKMVTAAAALEANLVDPTDVFDCERGSIVVKGKRIHDHHSFDQLTFREVIAKSSNVGAIKVGLLAGESALYEQIRKFGFGRLTGIDLPGESAGLLQPVERWHKRAVAYISFGQGLSVTAVQLASAFAAVANGGQLYRPYVVQAVSRDGVRQPVEGKPEIVGRAVSASTARTLERLLEAVVEEGTGRKAAIDGYRVAGKTGTAQKAAASGGYAQGRYVASFVGFAPARRPRLVGLVALDEPNPKRGYHGGDVAAPVFAAIVGPALLYLGVPPEREPMEVWPGQRDPSEQPVLTAASPPGQRPNHAETSQELLASTGHGEGSLPDFTGLTARQAVVRTATLGLRADLHGRGLVSRQVPSPGSAVETAEGRVELWLAGDSGR
ncbi:MAG: penicillin-binding transpeptidase domain-containing protein [Thermoanaerobaculia bacterium]